MRGGGRADRPGQHRPVDARRGAPASRARSATRLRQGGGRRRRQGHKAVRAAAELEAAYASARREGAGATSATTASISSSTWTSRATSRSRCFADAARQRHPPRRARLHDPAPAPEDHRGDALARRLARAARPHRRDRRRCRPRGRLRRCRDGGGAAGGRRLVLLPRDEHAPAGGAHGHRDGDRPRPGARADLGRRRPAAGVGPGRRAPLRPRHPVPHQRRGCGGGFRPDARAG